MRIAEYTPERFAERNYLIALFYEEHGATFDDIAKVFDMTRSAVAGVVYRSRNPNAGKEYNKKVRSREKPLNQA